MHFQLLSIAFVVLMLKHIYMILHYTRVIKELKIFIALLVQTEINEKDNHTDNH